MPASDTSSVHPPPTKATGDRPRALFLIHDLRPGGAERVFLRYVNELRDVEALPVLVRPNLDWAGELREGVPLLDLARSGESLLRDTRRDPPGRGGTGAVRPRARLPGARAVALIQKARRLSRVARALDARVVSTFLHKSHVIGTVAKLLFRSELRVVVNVHEQMSDHLIHHHPPADRLLYGTFVRHFFRFADRVVTVADGVKEDLVTNFSLDPARISVVRNPIDVGRIRRAAAEDAGRLDPEPGPGPVLVAVGRLVHLKGFDLLLRALARLPADPGAHLILVGDGEERGALEALSRELGLGERVTFTGFRENPWALMRRADLFVLPSRTEAAPNVLAEALALGLPVVACRCSRGVEEYLQPGPAGLLAEPENIEELAARIHAVLTDDALRERLRRAARRKARELEAGSGTEAYGRMLRSVLDEGGNAPRSPAGPGPASDRPGA